MASKMSSSATLDSLRIEVSVSPSLKIFCCALELSSGWVAGLVVLPSSLTAPSVVRQTAAIAMISSRIFCGADRTIRDRVLGQPQRIKGNRAVLE